MSGFLTTESTEDTEGATPETDAEIDIEMTCARYPKEYVSGDFARGLERERDEAREKAERYRLEANAIMLQRDEARERAAKLAAQLLSEMEARP